MPGRCVPGVIIGGGRPVRLVQGLMARSLVPSDQPPGRHGTMLSAQHGPPSAGANVARVYDSLLGGCFL